MNLNFHLDASTHEPAYLQLKEQLKAQIAGAKLAPGTALPSLKAIAALAGVSLRTADAGINKLIEEGVCYRRPKKGTFVGEGGLAPQAERRKHVAVCYGRDANILENDLIWSKIMRGVEAMSESCGFEVVSLSMAGLGKSLEFYRNSTELSLHGVLMLRWDGLEEVFRLAAGAKPLPFIFLNYYVKGFEDGPENVHGIFNDDFAGAYQMADYIASKHGGQISLFTIEMEDENYNNRVRGYFAALEARGVKVPPERVLSQSRGGGQTLQEAGGALAERLMASSPGCRIVLCVNDLMAEGALRRLKAAGLHDAVVAGYDNILAHVSGDANFPTCAIDFEAMGRKAVEMLSNPKREYPRTIRLVPQLIARG